MIRNDSQIAGHTPKAEPGSLEYKTRVAEPTMKAVDSLPKEYRAAVHQYGYIDVYLAWRNRLSVSQIHEKAQKNGGVFAIND